MKFFVYIADAKVDRSLAELTGEERDSLARELNVDVAFLNLAEVGRSAPDEVRFARATALGVHLMRTRRAAPLEGSAPFVADRRSLHWGRLRRVRGTQLLRHESESPVGFACSDRGRELIMMGPAAQLLAQPPSATVDEGREIARDAMHLSRLASDLDAIDRRSLQYMFDGTPPPTAAELRRGPLASTAWVPQLARLRADLRALPAQRLEFLAKPLASIEAGARVVLATPVYVAMAL